MPFLAAFYADDASGAAESDTICNGLEGEYSTGLHVIAVLCVLVGSTVGGVLPVLGKRNPSLRLPDYVYALGKSTGTGVMLAVGLIHMMGEAAKKFEASCVPAGFKEAYDSWAFLFAGIAMIVMHGVDVVIGEVVKEWVRRHETAESKRRADAAINGREEAHLPSQQGDVNDFLALEHQLFPQRTSPPPRRATNNECEGHQHGVVAPSDMGAVQRVVAAICMEFGVTLHSVLVGLDLGVTNDSEAKVLMVALLFHQLFEGLAMGSRLADAEFKLTLEVVLMLVFTLSAPVGVAVGIAAVSASPTALSGTTYVMVCSILDSICGGILVYLALSLMLVDFPKDLQRLSRSDGRFPALKKLGLFVALWVGAAVMMLIDEEVDSACTGLDGVYSSGIHIVALFVVLLASLLGALLPLLGKRIPSMNIPDYVYALGKSTGTGVMLAVGLIHMMGEAAEKFEASCVPAGFKEAYDSWAFLISGIAIILMHGLDILIGEVVHSWYERRATAAASSKNLPETVHHSLQEDGNNSAEDCVLDPVLGEVPCAEHGCEGHQHGVAAPPDMGAVQRVVAAICMEFGVTLHSVLVGLDLGVTENTEVKVLMVALLFHQLFEGLAMGSRLADAEFKLTLEVVLMLVFTLSAPVGVAVGIAAVSASPTALSGTTYVMVSSILDSICGGILVYLALSLMLVDFPKDLRRLSPSDGRFPVLKKLGLFVALWVGAAVMMLIGKWC